MNWYVFFIVIWVIWIFGRLSPMKKRLQKDFGIDKPDSFFVALAKSGHSPSRRYLLEARIAMWVGILGGFLITLLKVLSTVRI